MTDSLWGQVERLLPGVERPARYIDAEWGAIRKPECDYRAVLLYPDTYEVGMANQALTILYERLNSIDGVAAERAFVPWVDMADAMRAAGVPLWGLESFEPVRTADMFGITLPYELTHSNILEALDLAGIPLRATERTNEHPLVIGGGPATFNPEPIAPFFDALLIGEGEEAVTEIVAAHRQARDAGSTREGILRALAQVLGVYVPSLYETSQGAGGRIVVTEAGEGVSATVEKRVVPDIGTYPTPECPVVPFMDVVHDRATTEVLRGCTRGCRFCQAGMIYRPVRERTADDVVRDALASLRCTGHNEISLSSLSTTDHSQIEEILRRLANRLDGTATTVSLPSLRADALSVDMARIVARGRSRGLTLAPEAGSQRLRDVINKNVTEEDLISTVEHASDAGWHRVKLYFMIGLPTETDDDIREIGSLVGKVVAAMRERVSPDRRGSVRVSVSVATLVPKSHTPFQWEPQLPLAEVERKQVVLRESMPRKGVELSWHDSDVSFLEGLFARGGRELADVIENAWHSGARFDAWGERFDLGRWRDAFAAAGIDPDERAAQCLQPGEQLPWSHISCGVSEKYLLDERDKATAAETTPDCSFEACTGCDACQDLDVDIVLGGECRGSR